jgi:hypothetical protein
LRSGKGFPWTQQQVRKELLATIVSAYCWNEEEPLLEVTVALKNYCSLVRVDLGSRLALITTEDAKDPAIKCMAGSFYYNVFREDLRASLGQARELDRTANGVNFADLNPQSTRILLEGIGLRTDDLDDSDLAYISKTAQKPEDPYG